MSAAWFSAITGLLGVIVAGLGVFVAYSQLKGLSETLKMNALMAVLNIESDLNQRKVKLDEVNFKIHRFDAERNDDDELTEGEKSLLEIYQAEQDTYLENYLNSMDRLAYCILRGYLQDKDWKAEYREMFAVTIRNNQEKFGTGTYYSNIVDLHHRWTRS